MPLTRTAEHMRVFDLTTLGRVSLTNSDGAPVATLLAQPKRLGVLVYVAVAGANDVVRRDTLCELFWPDAPPDRARASLRQALAFLRRALGDDAIITRGDDEVGVEATRVRCDAAVLRTRLMTRDLDRSGVLALYTGAFMPDFGVDEVPRFDRWLEDVRSAFARDVGEAAITLARAAVTQGDVHAVVWARRACEVLPFDERALVLLMEALDAAGDRAGALQRYDMFVQRLAESLEEAPEPETAAVAQEMRTRAVRAPREPERSSHEPAQDEAIERVQLQRAPTEHLPLTATPTITPMASQAIESHPVRQVWRRGGVVAVAVCAVAVIAVSWLARPTTRPDVAPASVIALARMSTAGERVLVTPFVNETGDSTLDALGRMAADWITEGFSRINGLAVVPGTTLLAMDRARRVGDGAVPVQLDAMARETGATIVVAGSYYRTGGTLHVQARLTDASLSTLLRPAETVSVPIDSIEVGVAMIRERVLANMAPLLDSTTHFRLASTPPSYEAYSDFLTGFEHFVDNDFATALTLFERAAAADTTYRMAQLAAAITQMHLGDNRGVFARLRALKESRDRFGPVEQGTLDMIDGLLRGDIPAVYAAVSRTARITPGSIVEYMVAESARRLNRPQEALRVLRRLNPDHGELRGWSAYWREMGYALHMTGDYAGVLAMTRGARKRYPDSGELLATEVRALAALGRVDSVNAVLAKVDVRPGALRELVGAMYVLAAEEFVLGGDAAGAGRCARRAVAWYQAAAHRARRGGYVRALRLAGQHEAAWRAVVPFADTISTGTSSLEDLGMAQAPDLRLRMRDMGVMAAQRGDTALAARWELRLVQRQLSLEEPFRGSDWAGLQLDRAAIAAQRGELNRAIELVREALSRGLSYWPGLAADIDLAPLHDHPAWRALLQPAG